MPRELAPEMLLANELAVFEPPDHGITAADLQALAGPVLHREAIDLTDAPDRQIEVALRSPHRYVAVTDDETYCGLMPIETIVRDVLRSTVVSMNGR